MSKFMLIPEEFRGSMIRQLKARVEELEKTHGNIHHTHAPKAYIGLFEHAATIELPEIHMFRDGQDQEYMSCGWGQGDAKAHLLKSHPFLRPDELRCTGSCDVHPGLFTITIP